MGDSRKWYHKEVRIIRNDREIHAYRDAQGFRKGSEKIRVKPVDATGYHYGWVKNPRKRKEKLKDLLVSYWADAVDEPANIERASGELFDFSQFDSLTHFKGEHPAVMKKRIAEKNWTVDLDVSKKKLSPKEKILYWLEKKTGKRWFDFKNYKII